MLLSWCVLSSPTRVPLLCCRFPARLRPSLRSAPGRSGSPGTRRGRPALASPGYPDTPRPPRAPAAASAARPTRPRSRPAQRCRGRGGGDGRVAGGAPVLAALRRYSPVPRGSLGSSPPPSAAAAGREPARRQPSGGRLRQALLGRGTAVSSFSLTAVATSSTRCRRTLPPPLSSGSPAGRAPDQVSGVASPGGKGASLSCGSCLAPCEVGPFGAA